jgi:hypothetical protein
VSHPLLDRSEVHARLQVRGRESRAVFVQETVIAARTIRAGVIALVTIAAVKLCPMSDPLADIQEMIVRPSAAGREQELPATPPGDRESEPRAAPNSWG